MIGKIERVRSRRIAIAAATQISTDTGKNTGYLGATRAIDVEIYRGLLATEEALRTCSVAVTLARGEKRWNRGIRSRWKRRKNVFATGKNAKPCDRFDPARGALMAIVCPRHTLLAISSEESSRGIGNAVDQE